MSSSEPNNSFSPLPFLKTAEFNHPLQKAFEKAKLELPVWPHSECKAEVRLMGLNLPFEEIQSHVEGLQRRKQLFVTQATELSSNLDLEEKPMHLAKELLEHVSIAPRMHSVIQDIILLKLSTLNAENWDIYFYDKTNRNSRQSVQLLRFGKPVDNRWNFGLFKWGRIELPVQMLFYEYDKF
jgi:hypothetical protein